MKFTIIGASGFIGSSIAKVLKEQGYIVNTPSRGDNSFKENPLGHVIYAAGVTSDFRKRPFDTLKANTIFLSELLENATFDSFLYLSSARIYRHSDSTKEDATIYVRPYDSENLYDLTKLTSESLCNFFNNPSIRIVRLTNVIGNDFESNNFVFDIIKSACDSNEIILRSSIESAKDYILIEDVLKILPKISINGRERCYNLGSGENISHKEITSEIQKHTGAAIKMSENTSPISSAPLNIDKIVREFGFKPTPVLPVIKYLIKNYQNNKQ